MKVIILGAGGMLGHQLWLRLAPEAEVLGTLRGPLPPLEMRQSATRRLLTGVDALDEEGLHRLLRTERPDVLVNAVGLIKQLPEGKLAEPCIRLNSLLPHVLHRICRDTSTRLIHISTDCVFSGAKGAYTEADLPDAEDVYGRSKALGEVVAKDALTIRTSIIGHELKQGLSLLEWFLKQKSAVTGFAGVFYNGLTTVELASLISTHILPNPDLTGLLQAASEPIDKYSLLKLFADSYHHEIEIHRASEPVFDKTLKADRLHELTGYKAPPWPVMIQSMAEAYRDKKSLYERN